MSLHQRQVECVDHGYKGDSFGYQKTHYRNDAGQRIGCMRHRLVYAQVNGLQLTDLRGKVVRHTCDNPRCINPEHLEIGTQGDNIHDRQLRNRQANGSEHGLSKLSESDVKFIRSNYKKRSKDFNTVTLGVMYGVSARNILDVINRVTWSHI